MNTTQRNRKMQQARAKLDEALALLDEVRTDLQSRWGRSTDEHRLLIVATYAADATETARDHLND